MHKETIPKKKVLNDMYMLKQLFFTHRLPLNGSFSDTEMAISGQQRSDSSVLTKTSPHRNSLSLTPASPTMVRATGICVLAAATRQGQGTF